MRRNHSHPPGGSHPQPASCSCRLSPRKTGAARLLWMFAGLVLWLGLVWQARRRAGLSWWAWGFLVPLGLVPFVLFWASERASYPPVDPDTGGATGASLLGSTLGVVGLFGVIPWLLRLPPVLITSTAVREHTASRLTARRRRLDWHLGNKKPATKRVFYLLEVNYFSFVSL